MNNKGDDYTTQMHRLVCMFVVCIHEKRFSHGASSIELAQSHTVFNFLHFHLK